MSEIIKVMVNGLPGKMATKVAEHVLADNRFELIQGSNIDNAQVHEHN